MCARNDAQYVIIPCIISPELGSSLKGTRAPIISNVHCWHIFYTVLCEFVPLGWEAICSQIPEFPQCVSQIRTCKKTKILFLNHDNFWGSEFWFLVHFSVEMSWLFCHSDFTWNQISKIASLRFYVILISVCLESKNLLQGDLNKISDFKQLYL